MQKSLLRKYCIEGASVETYFWVPTQKKEKIQKKIKKIYRKNNSSEKRMLERLENDQKLVDEV